jgi:hypothetical protein
MKEALKLALEALEGVLDDAPKVLDASIAGGLYEVVQCRDAITAIKAALAQPAQEPVAWMSPSWIDPDTRGWQSDSFESIPIEGWLPIYTTPPQRTWVSLTDEEVGDLSDFAYANDEEFVRQVEKHLKEKNNG